MQETGIQLVFGGKSIHRNGALSACQEVVLLEPKAIGTIGKGDIHHLSILLGLLHSVTHRVVGILGLDNGNRSGTIVIEHVVGILSLATCHKVTPQINLAIGKLNPSLHRDVCQRPAFAGYRWRDVSQLDIFFAQQEVIDGWGAYYHILWLVNLYAKITRSGLISK